MRFVFVFLSLFVGILVQAQTPSSIEAVEYDPDGNRWFVSNESSLLVTEDQGESWSFFGEASASHGMEVMNGVLYAIGGNVIRAYSLESAEFLGSLVIPGVGFLNGMGSDGNSMLVVSDFQGDRLYTINAEAPEEMSYALLTGNLGETPNGVVVDTDNNRAIVVCWGNNADILSVDLESGDVSTLVDGSGLGNLDGIDNDGNGQYYVSSWSPTRITRFNADFTESETVVTGSAGLSSPADISYAVALDTLGVANSGTDVVTFHGFGSAPSGVVEAAGFSAQRAGMDMLIDMQAGRMVHLSAYDASGRILVKRSEYLPSGQMRWAWPLQNHQAGFVKLRCGDLVITLR
jgi:hypothetical protein